MVSLGAQFDTGPSVGDQARFVEDHGFEYVYVPDSPINWREMSPYLTVLMHNTTAAKVGACVTNPVTRNPTVLASLHAALQELSGGRMILGLGRGDSAVRRLGERPARLKEFEEASLLIHRLTNGEEVTYAAAQPSDEDWYAQAAETVTLSLEWAPRTRIPLYVAGYGPKMLRWAGRVADGVFLQIADLETVEWHIGFVRQGAADAGRDLSEIDIVVCTPSWVSDDLHDACDRVRPFPSYVANHVTDMLRFHPRSSLPASFLRCVEDKAQYDYREHTQTGAEHAGYISDDLAESYTIVGTPESCAEKIRRLSALGVTQICIYYLGYSDADIRATTEAYAREVMPRV